MTDATVIGQAPVRHRISDLPWPVWLFIGSMIVPSEFFFEIEGIRIGPQRLVLLIATGGIVHWLWRQGRVRVHDALVLAGALWGWGACFVTLAPAAAVERGGAFFLEVGVAYLLPSACLASVLQVRLAVRAFVPVVGVLACLGALEATTGVHFIANASAALMDAPDPFVADTRLGLLRARTTFAHQILFGVFCASLVALFWFEARSPMERAWRSLAVGAGVFFSLSSAAWILLALQAGLIAAERATRGLARRVAIALALTLSAGLFLELVVQGGVTGFVTRYLALNSDTAYYRQLIWSHVSDDILAHPLAGTGGPWTRLSWMVESIDQTYFAKAIRYGIPAIALIAAGAVAIGLALVRAGAGTAVFRALRIGWILGVLAIALAGLTVDYFGRALPYVMFIVGLGAALERAASCDR